MTKQEEIIIINGILNKQSKKVRNLYNRYKNYSDIYLENYRFDPEFEDEKTIMIESLEELIWIKSHAFRKYIPNDKI